MSDASYVGVMLVLSAANFWAWYVVWMHVLAPQRKCNCAADCKPLQRR